MMITFLMITLMSLVTSLNIVIDRYFHGLLYRLLSLDPMYVYHIYRLVLCIGFLAEHDAYMLSTLRHRCSITCMSIHAHGWGYIFHTHRELFYSHLKVYCCHKSQRIQSLSCVVPYLIWLCKKGLWMYMECDA